MTSLPLRLLAVVVFPCALLGCASEGSSTPTLNGTWGGECRSAGQEYERTLIAFDEDRLGVRNFRYADSGCAVISESGSRFTEGRYTIVGPTGSGAGTQWNIRDVTGGVPGHDVLLPAPFDLYAVRGDQLHYGDYTTGDGASESQRPTAPSETAIATYVGPGISDVFGQSVRGSTDPQDLIGRTIELSSNDEGRELCEYYLSDGRVKGWRRQVGGYDGTWRIEGDLLCVETALLGPRGCVSVELSSTGGSGQYFGSDGTPPWPWAMEVDEGDQCAMEPISFFLEQARVKRVPEGDGCWDGLGEGDCAPDLFLEITLNGDLAKTTVVQPDVDPSASQPARFVGELGLGLLVVPYPDTSVKVRLWDDDDFSAPDDMGATEGVPVSMTFFDPPNERFRESMTGELDLVSTDGTIEVTLTGSFSFECNRPSFAIAEAESCPGLIPAPSGG